MSIVDVNFQLFCWNILERAYTTWFTPHRLDAGYIASLPIQAWNKVSHIVHFRPHFKAIFEVLWFWILFLYFISPTETGLQRVWCESVTDNQEKRVLSITFHQRKPFWGKYFKNNIETLYFLSNWWTALMNAFYEHVSAQSDRLTCGALLSCHQCGWMEWLQIFRSAICCCLPAGMYNLLSKNLDYLKK